MTNKAAYLAYCNDESKMLLSLEQYSIDPTLTDKTQISSALGMIDCAVQPDYRQGSTQETMPVTTRRYMLARGKAILKDNGIELMKIETGNIINCYGI